MNISDKVIKRLTLYHYIFTDYLEKNIEVISSPQIAALLNIDDSQVRKDLKYLNNEGKCRVGYNVRALKESIERLLGYAEKKNAIIVGAGNLGLALTKYDDFSSYGLNIVALFDNDPLKVGMSFNDKKVFSIGKLEKYTKENKIEIAILTVPRLYAQEVADILVNAKIKYIWNFTPSILRVSKNVKVWNENLMGSCLQFTAQNKKYDKIEQTSFYKKGNVMQNEINISVCTGSTCYTRGRAILTELLKIVPQKYGSNVKVAGVPCLEVCSIDWGHEKAPYVKINEEILNNATVEKVIARVDELLNGAGA
ncbi:MAG: redox-sensing transcriptional repressor Rex [bacterium]|nr:redox-sensing transcriptional repressor Rex [bacterium]